MNMKHFVLGCVMALTLLFAGHTQAASITTYIAVVDVEKVLKESKASDKGRAHLAEAKKRLQAGWEELQKTWGKMPEKERANVYARGLAALNQQMANEETAANQVVLTLMREKATEWRKDSKVPYVIAKQNMLDADDATDITAEVIKLMDKVEPKFAELPTVKVHEPKAKPEPAKPAGPKADPRAKQQPRR